MVRDKNHLLHTRSKEAKQKKQSIEGEFFSLILVLSRTIPEKQGTT